MQIRRIAVNLLKLVFSGAILGYLVWDAVRNDSFRLFWQQPKQWHFFAIGSLLSFSAVVLTLVRWCLLGRALDMQFSLRNALRFGFLGYMFNLAPLGIVGGDVVKMVLLARHNKGRHSEAVASVIVDRLTGLYTLFVLASVMVLCLGTWKAGPRELQLTSLATLVVTAAGTIVVISVLSPRSILGTVAAVCQMLPLVGQAIAQVITAADRYRSRSRALWIAFSMSFAVHLCFSSGLYFLARALFDPVPTYLAHLVAGPLTAAAGVLPLPMGPAEFVFDRLYLYLPVPNGEAMVAGQGLIIMLAYRLVTVGIAAVGLVYYFAAREKLNSNTGDLAACKPFQA